MMSRSSPKYRKILAELDSKGMICCINRESPRSFTVWINGEAVKNYKKRDSANQYIVRLYKKNGGGNFSSTNNNKL